MKKKKISVVKCRKLKSFEKYCIVAFKFNHLKITLIEVTEFKYTFICKYMLYDDWKYLQQHLSLNPALLVKCIVLKWRTNFENGWKPEDLLASTLGSLITNWNAHGVDKSI